jgi:CheY-like chemotaxis protein
LCEAANGQEALRLCGEVQSHVIKMDMMLPDMDGIALIRSIRAR